MKLSLQSPVAGFCSCLALPLLMVGCESIGDSIKRNSPVERSGPIAPASYASMVGDTSFKLTRSETFPTGCSVESGNLLGRHNSIGTLIMVRAPSGELTGIVDRPGKQGSDMYFQVSFEPGDNPTLLAGLYNGTLEMKALDAQTPPPLWSPKIFASITIQKK